MWRFFAIATAIVAAVLAAIFALPHAAGGPTPASQFSSSTGTPGPAQRDGGERRAGAVSGDAPWALSALPDCFRQLFSASGPPAFARAKIPAGARRVAAGSRLRVSECTLTVGVDSGSIARGENRLRVPPSARFYVAGKRLILDRRDGAHEDVRAYALATGARPSFEPAAAPKP